MANYDVGFEITADTRQAGKAIMQLSRLINDAIAKADKALEANPNDKGLKQKRAEYQKLKGEIDKVIASDKKLSTYEAELGKIKGIETRLAGIDTSTKAGKDEAKKLEEQLRLKKQQLDPTEKLAQKELKRLLGNNALKVTDENILGIKLEEKKATEDAATAAAKEADAAKQTATANKEAKANAQASADAANAERKAVEELGNARAKTSAITTPSTKATKGKAKGTPATENLKQTTADAEAANEGLRGMIGTLTEISAKLKENNGNLQEANDLINQFEAVNKQVANTISRDVSDMGYAELVRHLYDLRNAQAGIEKMGMPQNLDRQYDNIVLAIDRTKQAMRDWRADAAATEPVITRVGESGKKASDLIKRSFSVLPKLIGVIKRGFSSLANHADKTKASFDGMARNMKSNLKHMITRITKYVFGFRSLFFLVRRLRKYIGEGIQGMAQYNKGNNSVNANISKLITSLEYLKNAWSTAFDPILQFVTPWLSTLLDKLAEAGNAFSRFVASLLGVNKIFQAVKGPTKNYAKTLDKSSKGAGKAAKKQKELNDRLADFDVLHVLGKDNDNKNNGGGSGSGDDDDKKRNQKLWKFAKVADDLKKKLLAMWETGDFSSLGETIADKLRQVFEKLNKKMPEILKNAWKFGKSIATFLNGLLKDPALFAELGKFVANLGNTLTQTIAGFFANYTPGSIGTAIASFFKGVFANFQWGTAGNNLSKLVSTFFTELSTLFREFPVDEFMNGIKAFFAGIDWKEVIASVFDALGSAADLAGRVLTSISDSISKITPEDIIAAFEKVDWKKVGEGFSKLLSGIVATSNAATKFLASVISFITDALKNMDVKQVGQDLGDMISRIDAKSIADAIAALLGASVKLLIASPQIIANIIEALVRALGEAFGNKLYEWSQECGGNLIEGLLYGIGKAMVGMGNWVADNIVAPIVEAFKTLFQIHSPSKVTEEWGVFLIQGLVNGLASGIETIKQKWQDIKTAMYNKALEIKSNLGLVWDSIKFDISTKFTLIKNKIIEIWDGIKEGLKKPVNGIISIVENCINAMISGINNIAKKLNSLPSLQFQNPFTGKEYKLGFKIPELNKVSIPRLAQGAVIPPNREFLATLGDQSHGTNIEAPLDTIKQAVAEVLATNGNQEVIQLLQQLIAVVESKNLVIGDKEIGRANARYTNQQKIVRGTTF